MSNTKYPGLFITLEGVDAAGKTSHVEAIKDYIEKTTGKTVVMTREPGGTPLANEIRTLVKTKEMSAATELLLLNAARQDHIENVILPALESGHVVVCDRFTDSTYAYQGGAKQFSMDKIEQLEHWVQNGLSPDMTMYFDVNLKTSKERRDTRGESSDRLEDAMDANFTALRNVYLSIAEKEPNRVKKIDGSPSLEVVRDNVLSIVGSLIEEKFKKIPKRPKP